MSNLERTSNSSQSTRPVGGSVLWEELLEESHITYYPGDTRPEFKMWGGASKSVFVLVLKNMSTSI